MQIASNLAYIIILIILYYLSVGELPWHQRWKPPRPPSVLVREWLVKEGMNCVHCLRQRKIFSFLSYKGSSAVQCKWRRQRRKAAAAEMSLQGHAVECHTSHWLADHSVSEEEHSVEIRVHSYCNTPSQYAPITFWDCWSNCCSCVMKLE